MRSLDRSKIANLAAGIQTVANRKAHYEHMINQCPPVAQVLVDHLERVFSRPQIKPTDPLMANHLIYQAGIEKVKDYLIRQLEAQEAAARTTREKVT